ncbi:arsenate reductase [Pseudomonadales bacterium]|nr:arsenate reductase [Pseudomonadales bacterium]
MITLYGISNCDSVKKAKKWLSDNAIVYVFHDFRADGLTTEQIKHWLGQVPREKLLNKRSTTWKQLPDALKKELIADNAAESLFVDTMIEYPTLIKRPVLAISNDNIQVGFSAIDYQQLLS